jgi:glutamine amidotransferase
MCELFALSSRYPANARVSIGQLAAHGGLTGPHVDGWGFAFIHTESVDLFQGLDAAADSPAVHNLANHDLQSQCIVGHIRKATVGAVNIENTQPFRAVVGRDELLFAHNGDLQDISDLMAPEMLDQAEGDTDSEQAFCLLRHRWRNLLNRCASDPGLAERRAVVQRFAAQIRPLGPANFLFHDGTYLYVHAHQRTQADGEVRPPGLFHLQRECLPDATFNGGGVALTNSDQSQRVSLFVSMPLSDEPWRPLAEGELLVVNKGSVLA